LRGQQSAVSTTKDQESEDRELDRVEKSECKGVSEAKDSDGEVTPCHSGTVSR